MNVHRLFVRNIFALGLQSCLLAQGVSFQYQSVPVGGFTHMSVVSSDVNRDGKPDLVFANYAGASISVLLGRGDGTFDAETRYSVKSAPSSVAVADLNGDGTPDLVVASYGSSQVSVLLGAGDGTFKQPVNYVSYATSNNIEPYAVAAGDFNGDSKADLAVTNYSSTGFPFAEGKSVSILIRQWRWNVSAAG